MRYGDLYSVGTFHNAVSIPVPDIQFRFVHIGSYDIAY